MLINAFGVVLRVYMRACISSPISLDIYQLLCATLTGVLAFSPSRLLKKPAL